MLHKYAVNPNFGDFLHKEYHAAAQSKEVIITIVMLTKFVSNTNRLGISTRPLKRDYY